MRPVDPEQLSRLQRVLMLLGCLTVLTGFGLAGWMTPDPRGYGTHQQLGLPPCEFQAWLGLPCPSCGGTTCLAHFVRGEWISAWRANAGAWVLAFGCLVFAPWSLISACRGRWAVTTRPGSFCLMFLILLSVVALVHWIWRLRDVWLQWL